MTDKKPKKSIVFVDGGNFYFRLKYLINKLDDDFSLLNFNFRGFIEDLIYPNKTLEIRYYIGAIKQKIGDKKSEKLYANQQRLISKLRNNDIKVILGSVIQHPDSSYHEKGVDVRIAVEMIRLARQDKYERGYLLSSDTDLTPAVEEVRSFNKEIYYVGTDKGQSFGLTKVSDRTILLRPSDIENYLPEPF